MDKWVYSGRKASLWALFLICESNALASGPGEEDLKNSGPAARAVGSQVTSLSEEGWPNRGKNRGEMSLPGVSGCFSERVSTYSQSFGANRQHFRTQRDDY